MTPKEKAKDLFKKHLIYFPEFYNVREFDYNEEKAKRCAIMVCDEIHEALKQTFHQMHKKTEMTPDLYLSESIAVHYYQEVKQEIEKL
jgi:hypothetical protein